MRCRIVEMREREKKVNTNTKQKNVCGLATALAGNKSVFRTSVLSLWTNCLKLLF